MSVKNAERLDSKDEQRLKVYLLERASISIVDIPLIHEIRERVLDNRDLLNDEMNMKLEHQLYRYREQIKESAFEGEIQHELLPIDSWERNQMILDIIDDCEDSYRKVRE